MYCYIKEWPNKMATLMTTNGVVLCTCRNADEAQQVWRDWQQQQKPPLSDTTEHELPILSYSPTIIEWLKTIAMNYYVRRSIKLVNM